jgi:hypothetical protein
MRAIADVVRQLVSESPFLEDGLARGIINLSALARELRPRVEAELVKEIGEGALVMALKRLTPKIREQVGVRRGLPSFLKDLTVRSDLSEITFVKSQTLPAKQRELLAEAQRGAHEFVTFTRGSFEVTAIFDSSLREAADRIFAGETVVSRLDDLAAITIRLAAETVETCGVYYEVLKRLAMWNINLVEVVSTYTELTVILDRDQVDRAFSILLAASTSK